MALEGQLLGHREDAKALSTKKKKKEEFIKFEEFATLCSDKALKYFELGFKGCVSHLTAHGYFEAEHP